MNTKRNKLASIVTVVLTVAVLLFMWSPGNASASSVLPDGVVVSDTFYPGYGSSIGKVQRVKGEVVGVHAHAATQGFRLRPRNMLYRGDTIYTMEKGRVRFRMNDGSILSLASETKLELNKSVYDKKKKSRSSFLNMAFGKARFLVVKLVNFKRSEFKVKTPTAVCGVRGSDYVVEASEALSVFIALEATTIEVRSAKNPKAEPVVLNEYEMSKVYLDGYPSEPVKLTPEEIKRVVEQFISVDPDKSEPEPGEIQARVAKEAGEDEVGVSTRTGTKEVGTGTKEVSTGTEAGGQEVVVSDVRVLVPEDAIVPLPEDFGVGDEGQGDIGKVVESSGITEDSPSIIRSDIVEQFNEDDVWPSGFPGNPEQ